MPSCGCLWPSHVAFLLFPPAAGTGGGAEGTAVSPHLSGIGDGGRGEEVIIKL